MGGWGAGRNKRMGQDSPCLVSWGQRLQESSWQEKETKNNPERESPERGTGKWGGGGPLEQGNSDASLTAQAWMCVCTDAHTLPHRQHITHINPRTPLTPRTIHCVLHSPTAYLPSKHITNTLLKHTIQHSFLIALETAHTYCVHKHLNQQTSTIHTTYT